MNSVLLKHGIPWANCICLSVDNASVNMEAWNSLCTRLQQKISELMSLMQNTQNTQNSSRPTFHFVLLSNLYATSTGKSSIPKPWCRRARTGPIGQCCWVNISSTCCSSVWDRGGELKVCCYMLVQQLLPLTRFNGENCDGDGETFKDWVEQPVYQHPLWPVSITSLGLPE